MKSFARVHRYAAYLEWPALVGGLASASIGYWRDFPGELVALIVAMGLAPIGLAILKTIASRDASTTRSRPARDEAVRWRDPPRLS